jgi:hypothetical protein
MNPNPNLNLLIPFLLFGGLFGGGSRQRMADIFRQSLLPISIGPGLAALVADRELRRQEEADTKMIQQVVDNDQITSDQALKDKFPLLHEVFAKLPAGSIIFPTP